MAKKGSGKKGGKKIGRNKTKPTCKRYTNSARWLTNKIKKINRHLKNHEKDLAAVKALA